MIRWRFLVWWPWIYPMLRAPFFRYSTQLVHQSVPLNPHTLLCKLSYNESTFRHLGILAALDFHRKPRQFRAGSWLLRVDNENTSTVKAASYQTQQHMEILLTSAWSIMSICDCLNQPTKPSVFRVECNFSTYHDFLSLHWYYPCRKSKFASSER